jgi:hypothetical protein
VIEKRVGPASGTGRIMEGRTGLFKARTGGRDDPTGLFKARHPREGGDPNGLFKIVTGAREGDRPRDDLR